MDHLKHLVPYVRRHMWRIVIGMFAIAAGTALSVVQPFILRLAIDSLQHHPSLTD